MASPEVCSLREGREKIPKWRPPKAADRGRGGSRDPEVHRRVLHEVHQSVCSHGAAIMEGMESPISGAKGNLEYLVHVVLGGTHPGFDPAALVTGSPGAGRVGAL